MTTTIPGTKFYAAMGKEPTLNACLDKLGRTGGLLLNVGAGEASKKKLGELYGFKHRLREKRLDLNPDTHPDYLADMHDMKTVPDNTFDVIHASHVLEHTTRAGVTKVLDEFLRVLKPHGVALVIVPDLLTAAEHIVKGRLEEAAYHSAVGSITPLDMLYGHGIEVDDNPFMCHKTGFTNITLGRRMNEAGFVATGVWRDGFNVFALGEKGNV
jgi:SAM-dependent methyltransferase